jgi:hypothetical protein
MFPGPGAEIHRNEVGEVLGWDYPDYEPPWTDETDYDDYEWYEKDTGGWFDDGDMG